MSAITKPLATPAVSKGVLKARCVSINALRQAQIEAMFLLFTEYYDQVSYSQFQTDLRGKDHVFLLCDPSGEIRGFSTIVAIHAEREGRPVRGLFSGDTVVHKDYWGSGALGVAFLKYLFLQKLSRPFEPLYWFLISKGYRTYLMMANNFAEHYPRYEQPTPPDMQALIDRFALILYPDRYDPALGTIPAAGKACDRLKADVAPIGENLLANPRIAYFVERNPGW